MAGLPRDENVKFSGESVGIHRNAPQQKKIDECTALDRLCSH